MLLRRNVSAFDQTGFDLIKQLRNNPVVLGCVVNKVKMCTAPIQHEIIKMFNARIQLEKLNASDNNFNQICEVLNKI